MPRQYNKRVNKEIETRICDILAAGCTRAAAFADVDISKTTFYRWMREQPKFKAAIEKAESKARVIVETELVVRARAGDRLLLMYWLQNRYPDDWKDMRKFEVDQRTSIEDKRVGTMSNSQILDELEKAGVDVSGFREPGYRKPDRTPK